MARLPLADRRDQLVAAALAIAARDGIEAATVRAVALEAGVSAGVVHYCFSDKNELLTCMATAITQLNTPELPGEEPQERQDPDGDVARDAEEEHGGGVAAAENAPDGATTPPPPTEPPPATEPPPPTEPPPVRDVLGELLSAMWASLEATPGYQLLTYELTVTALRSRELDGVAQEQYRAQHRAAAGVLEQAAELSAVRWSRPVEELARIVVAAVDGVALAWLVDRDGAAAQRTLAATVDLVCSYAVPAADAEAAGSSVLLDAVAVR